VQILNAGPAVNLFEPAVQVRQYSVTRHVGHAVDLFLYFFGCNRLRLDHQLRWRRAHHQRLFMRAGTQQQGNHHRQIPRTQDKLSHLTVHVHRF
jgi:hypothetical protein